MAVDAYESGQTLGRYRVVRPLGMGAMGRVYLAEDPRIERLLAIKTVRVEGGHTEIEDRKRRLLREAKAAGKLSHHHIVTLYDAGEDGDTLFLAFEYIKGSDLSARLASGPPLTLGEALRAVRQAAEGLEYAHQQGIVHRDIKPSNLMLDERGWIKVSDFGIAKLAGQSTELTMTGSVVGSPHYLSPEQIRGEELDGRSDLFSLGVVLYELLGGKRPFEAETLTALIYQILNTEPPPPLAPGEPLARLNALVRRMMAKERDERFAAAAQVVAEISAVERELRPDLLASPASRAMPQAEPPTLVPPRPGAAPRSPTLASAAAGQASSRGGRTLLFAGLGLAAVVVLGAASVFGWKVLRPAIASRVAGGRGAEVAKADPGGTGEVPPAGEGALGTAAADAGRSPLEDPASGQRAAASGPAEAPARPLESGGRTSPAAPPSAPATRPATGGADTPRTGRQPIPPSAPPPTTIEAPARPATSEPATGLPRRDAVPPASDAPPGERVAPEPAAEEPPARPALRYDREVSTGMTLRFAADPADAFVLVDGRLVGKASELSAQGGYTLPEPGEHLVVLRKEGREDARLLVRASAGGGASSLPVRLPFRDAASSELGDLQLVRVQQGVAFKVEPKTARVLVDGVDRGAASDFGGLGRGWLKLPAGRHRVSLVAPGHRRVDLAVEVSSGASEERETIRLKLPPEGG